MHYFGKRFLSTHLNRWVSPDPLAIHSPGEADLNVYAYARGMTLKATDPLGLDAMVLSFPDYRVRTGAKSSGKDVRMSLGHAGVLIIDNKTGKTRYYEYGRYGDDRGVVRRKKVHDLKMDRKTRLPTQASMDRLLRQVSAISGDRGRVEGVYIKNDKSAEMIKYAEKRKAQNRDAKRKPYDLQTHNCASFCDDVVKSGGEKGIDRSPGLAGKLLGGLAMGWVGALWGHESDKAMSPREVLDRFRKKYDLRVSHPGAGKRAKAPIVQTPSGKAPTSKTPEKATEKQ